MAEAWGTPPWEILRAPASAQWAARFAIYQDELHKAKKAREAKR